MQFLIETNRGKIPAILLPGPPGIASDHAKKAFGPEKGPPSSEKFEADSIEGKIVRFKRILGEMRNMAELGSCRGPAPGPGLEQGPWGLEPAGLCGYPPAPDQGYEGTFLGDGCLWPLRRALSLWTLPSFVGGARPAPAVPGSSMHRVRRAPLPSKKHGEGNEPSQCQWVGPSESNEDGGSCTARWAPSSQSTTCPRATQALALDQRDAGTSNGPCK